MTPIQILCLGASVVLASIVVWLIRQKRLFESYALWWIVLCVGLALFSLSTDLLHLVASLLSVHYPPAVFIPLAFGLVIALSLHFSVIVTRLSADNQRMAQEIALLKRNVEEKLSISSNTQTDAC